MPSALVPPAAPVAPVTSSGIDPDLQRKIQEAKERIKSTIMKTNPYLVNKDFNVILPATYYRELLLITCIFEH